MDVTVVSLIFATFIVTVGTTLPTTQRFQAEKFLDMLSKSYDPKSAYADLLAALLRRLNMDPAQQSNSSISAVDGGSTNINALAETAGSCLEAPSKKGATITYTSDIRAVGSRALYQCEAGHKGKSRFIQCGSGGQWSLTPDWEGCSPVDCGPVPPTVPNAETSFVTTVFASVVLYNCQTGYKMNTTNPKIMCLETGSWEAPSFACEKEIPQIPQIPSITTAKQATNMPGGFQLPSHLLNLLPNGLPNAAGIKPENLMTLASMGLGSANPAAAPRDISQLLGSMNPMSMFGGGMGLNMGGAGAGGIGAGGMVDPELAEQREELMLRHMMTSAMKSMMVPSTQPNTTNNHNSAMDLMAMMALQNGLGGGGVGAPAGGAGGAGRGMDPLSMMFGGMGGLFGQA